MSKVAPVGDAIAGRFIGHDGLKLAADVRGDPAGVPVIFLHGGGQTRFSWNAAATMLAARGFRAITFDQRGHGESDWSTTTSYAIEDFAKDLCLVVKTFRRPVYLVGASLGGLASLICAAQLPDHVRGLVLVDIVPQIESDGSDRVRGFMQAFPDGFETLEAAADSVSAYLPHRPRPANNDGLLKNLRRREDGRLYWHWDPRFMAVNGTVDLAELSERLNRAAGDLRVPTLLVRGRLSDVVSLNGVKAFLDRVPHAQFVDVEGADHMVAGDRNDAFNTAILSFLE